MRKVGIVFSSSGELNVAASHLDYFIHAANILSSPGWSPKTACSTRGRKTECRVLRTQSSGSSQDMAYALMSEV